MPAPIAPRPVGLLRLATWNLHNLFDEVDDSYADKVPTHALVEKKLDLQAQVLNAMQADVMVVEEVENIGILQRLAQRVPGVTTAVLCEGNDKMRGIDVGFLSRVPVKGYRTHKRMVLADGGHFSRDCLEVHLGSGLIVLANHFKSKLGGRETDARRRAQAQGVVAIAAGLEKSLPGAGLAVIGDLNDGPHSWPLEPLRLYGLADCFGPLTMEQRYTLVYHGQLSIIDHILLNATLRRRYVEGSAKVWRLQQVEKASDHFPISLDLTN